MLFVAGTQKLDPGLRRDDVRMARANIVVFTITSEIVVRATGAYDFRRRPEPKFVPHPLP